MKTPWIALTALVLAAAPAAAFPNDNVRVMTQNMDEGTGFQRLAAATSFAEFVAAVAATLQDIESTRPAERAAAMAREIVRQRPDLVGLQEASMVRTGAPPASAVASDLLQSLLSALAALGEPYRVVAVSDRLDAEAPAGAGFDVRLTTRDAILAREGGAAPRLSNVRSSQFAVNLAVPTAAGPITLPRGWISVDVATDEGAFTFVSTHLDTVVPVQVAQVTELLSIFAAAPLPVVLSGDFNAVADDALDASNVTHVAVLAAGYADAWRGARGFTCCQDPDLLNDASKLDQRIDWILHRGALRLDDVQLVGDRQPERTASGLWPSDHAGLAASVRISP